jgi:superfamily II DNA or RNA helicase
MLVLKVENVWTETNEPDELKPLIGYTQEWWTQYGFRKKKQTRVVSLVSKKGFFLSGFVPRIERYLEKKHIEYKRKIVVSSPVKPITPHLQGIRFREDQKYALQMILAARRGVWQAPTGSGKTLLIAGILSAYPDHTAIVVVHTKSLFRQTIEEMQRFFSKHDVGYIGAGEKKQGRILIAMRQTLARHMENDMSVLDSYIVIIDEAHHVSTFKGEYAKILSSISAPVRIGFTATVPKTEEAAMAIEGFLGPKIGETKYKTLEEKEVLAKPKIKLYKVPESDKYKNLKGGYSEVYNQGIVLNRKRNVMIIKTAYEQIKKGKSVLVMVEKVNHGHELMALFDLKCPGVFVFVRGETKTDVREEHKRSFLGKERRGVIATRVWSEGVNIPTIDVVINAVGGESEIATIQRFGRGMRKAEKKNKVLLIDFIDTNHFWFQKHSLSRVCYYSEWGWL